ncbi:hypothetical protein NEOLI_000656 [Neolecta irregularis DAH-3]|uniref:Uncharacterized protein n=1 Tax=Neolecta irregularis (strain DAH-3) TaxID=1198029 RepID=A0A1U7LTC7_NEOID|nr:hypothetical protein NEOLI_000656 [Neolecta irregularis DAH-3]|eukprot:OLL25771.1 hypothetical protein NEOLI_000656 [Neolecta irregularis DAH-3]
MSNIIDLTIEDANTTTQTACQESLRIDAILPPLKSQTKESKIASKAVTTLDLANVTTIIPAKNIGKPPKRLIQNQGQKRTGGALIEGHNFKKTKLSVKDDGDYHTIPLSNPTASNIEYMG